MEKGRKAENMCKAGAVGTQRSDSAVTQLHGQAGPGARQAGEKRGKINAYRMTSQGCVSQGENPGEKSLEMKGYCVILGLRALACHLTVCP